MKLIKLHGKETKKQISDLLISNKAHWEGSPLHVLDLKQYKKYDLIKKVKIYNCNITAGGDGDISEYHNEKAYSFKRIVDNKVKKWLKSYGLTEKLIQKRTPVNKQKECEDEWIAYIRKEHNGFIGHDKIDMDRAVLKMKQIFISLSEILKINLKTKDNE